MNTNDRADNSKGDLGHGGGMRLELCEKCPVSQKGTTKNFTFSRELQAIVVGCNFALDGEAACMIYYPLFS